MRAARLFLEGLWSLVTGLGVTGRHFMRENVTLRYPHERPDVTHWGGPIELVRFPETGTHDCVACGACVRVCPSACMSVEGARPEAHKRMRATKFDIDFSLCSLCGLCVDVCPTGTLRHSTRYDEAVYSRRETHDDLVAPFGADPAPPGGPR